MDAAALALAAFFLADLPAAGAGAGAAAATGVGVGVGAGEGFTAFTAAGLPPFPPAACRGEQHTNGGRAVPPTRALTHAR